MYQQLPKKTLTFYREQSLKIYEFLKKYCTPAGTCMYSDDCRGLYFITTCDHPDSARTGNRCGSTCRSNASPVDNTGMPG
jgi:hypothetical protein